MGDLKLQQCRLDGRYDVLECLGRGSYAEVYRAVDRAATAGSPQMVVIKALNTSLQGEPDHELERTLIENFRNEALALDRVRHPNIISRLGHGTAIDLQGRSFHYLVLEYLPGGDMQTVSRRQPLPLERALFYFEQVAAGLAHAHANGVIHRDIKPQNLLLTADHAVVKIADFGVAKIEAAEGAITRVGTDVYAAPEHHPLMSTGPLDTSSLADNRAKHLTPAADVYSFAKTTYTLLTGEAPRRFAQRPITALPENLAGEPWAAFVLRVLRRATDTNPAGRYQTVREFRDEMNDATMPVTRALRPEDAERFFLDAGSPKSNGSSGDNSSVLNSAGLGSALPREAPPPPPSFTPTKTSQDAGDSHGRPRIVVPVAHDTPATSQTGVAVVEVATPRKVSTQEFGHDVVKPGAAATIPAQTQFSGRGRRWLVALFLIAAFALMLFATHKYVSGWRGTSTTGGRATATNTNASALGRRFVAKNDVNLRDGPHRNYPKIGEADQGAIVRVLNISGGWYEVEVVQRQRPKDDPNYAADRGWLDSDYLRAE